MTTTTTTRSAPTARADWLVPTLLILLSAVPVIAGAFRITELATGAEVTASNARFVAMPLPVVVHIVAATVYSVVGAFQLAPGFRRRHRRWHRAAGRLLVPCGLAVPLTGLWMIEVYDLLAADGALLVVFRHLFGWGMVASILLGVAALRRRDFRAHGAWMLRGYAIGLAAGTQVFTLLPWAVLVGEPGPLAVALLMAAGWVINLAVAEWVIRRRPTRRTRTAPPAVPAAAAPPAG